MQKAAYLNAIRNDSDLIVKAGESDLTAAVTCCPGWSLGDLIQHLGDVYGFVTDVVETRAIDEERDVAPLDQHRSEKREQRGDDFARSPDLVPWFRSERGRLLEVLTGADPGERVWTWWKLEQRAGFWQRRMAHETAVHRWDAQSAAGAPAPIERTLAADGVDEALATHAPERRSECDLPSNGETYRFEATDAGVAWTVCLGTDGVMVDRDGQAGSVADVSVRGTASDLVLFLWQRIAAGVLDVRGDVGMVDRWFELVPPE